jgi:hypothetical protein
MWKLTLGCMVYKFFDKIFEYLSKNLKNSNIIIKLAQVLLVFCLCKMFCEKMDISS